MTTLWYLWEDHTIAIPSPKASKKLIFIIKISTVYHNPSLESSCVFWTDPKHLLCRVASPVPGSHVCHTVTVLGGLPSLSTSGGELRPRGIPGPHSRCLSARAYMIPQCWVCLGYSDEESTHYGMPWGLIVKATWVKHWPHFPNGSSNGSMTQASGLSLESQCTLPKTASQHGPSAEVLLQVAVGRTNRCFFFDRYYDSSEGEETSVTSS